MYLYGIWRRKTQPCSTVYKFIIWCQISLCCTEGVAGNRFDHWIFDAKRVLHLAAPPPSRTRALKEDQVSFEHNNTSSVSPSQVPQFFGHLLLQHCLLLHRSGLGLDHLVHLGIGNLSGPVHLHLGKPLHIDQPFLLRCLRAPEPGDRLPKLFNLKIIGFWRRQISLDLMMDLIKRMIPTSLADIPSSSSCRFPTWVKFLHLYVWPDSSKF